MGAQDGTRGSAADVWPALGPELREIVRLAEEEARRRGQTNLLPRHLAYGLTRHAAGQAAVARAGIDPQWWRDYLCFVEGVNAVGLGRREGRHHKPWEPLGDATPARWDPVVDRVLVWAVEEAYGAGREVATPGDLLTALWLEATYEPAGTLRRLGLSLTRARAAAGHRHPTGRPWPLAMPAAHPPRGQGGPLILLGKGFDSQTGRGHGPWPQRAVELALAVRARRAGAAVDTPLRVVTLQTARPMPVPRIVEWSRQYYTECGVPVHVEVADSGLVDPRDSLLDAVVERLATADVVHLEGGRAERLHDATIGSPALEALAAASARGAVLVGGSAGAMIFGVGVVSEWHTGDPAHQGPVPLWGWLDRILVMPHYHPTQGTPGEARLREELAAFPGCAAQEPRKSSRCRILSPARARSGALPREAPAAATKSSGRRIVTEVINCPINPIHIGGTMFVNSRAIIERESGGSTEVLTHPGTGGSPSPRCAACWPRRRRRSTG